MIDYILFASKIPTIINRIESKTQQQGYKKTPPPKGWRNTTSIAKNGIEILFQHNRYKEKDTVFVGFSPHKLHNQQLHNANNFSVKQAQESILKAFKSIGIERTEICNFYVSNIEIGINFQVARDTYEVLDSALMFGKFFFMQHEKYRHYKSSLPNENKSNYIKAKFYIKAEQRNQNDVTNHDLGYCDKNTMRFEMKIKTSKFKFMDFKNAESLFRKETEEQLKSFLLKEYEKMFFFSLKTVNTRNLTNAQYKQFGRFSVTNFWKTLNPKERSREKTNYLNLPKKYDLKGEIRENILQSFLLAKEQENDLKKREEFPPKENRLQNAGKVLFNADLQRYFSGNSYIDIGKPPHFNAPKLRFCKITHLNITMQKKDSEFLSYSGLQWYEEHEPETFKNLCRQYLKQSADIKELQKKIIAIAHNIRNKDSNKRKKQKCFEKKFYNPSQLSFNFL